MTLEEIQELGQKQAADAEAKAKKEAADKKKKAEKDAKDNKEKAARDEKDRIANEPALKKQQDE